MASGRSSAGAAHADDACCFVTTHRVCRERRCRHRALFGIVRGTLYVLIAATIGAIGAFLLARYAARGAIERRLARHARFVAIDYAGAWSGRSCS
jgi:hypothetical protein